MGIIYGTYKPDIGAAGKLDIESIKRKERKMARKAAAE